MMPKDLAKPDIFIDFAEYKGDCLHIPRDPNDHYLIFVEKGGYLSKCQAEMKAGNELDITSLQADLAPLPQQKEEKHLRRNLMEELEAEPHLKRSKTVGALHANYQTLLATSFSSCN